jgi:acetylornithine deacetylase/succinyl-diaminopimelate desuccinylase-like protein
VLGEWRGAARRAHAADLRALRRAAAEPLELWESPAFEPTVRDGRIYARGSVDDKGQLFLHVKALEAHLAVRGTLPVNVIVLAEGEEEVGSVNLAPFIAAHRERLACDAVVISDSAMFAPGIPSILSSLRGLAYFEIVVQGPAGDLHSGSYGGAVVNPAMALARILATMHDPDGTIAIPGFYDAVRPFPDAVRAAMRGLPFDEEHFRAETGAPGVRRRGRLLGARAPVDAADVRGQRAALGLHRRGGEDGAPGEGDGQGELPAGARPGPGRGRAADGGARGARRAGRGRGRRPAPARRAAVAGGARGAAVRGGQARAGRGVRAGAGGHGRGRVDPGGRGLRADPRGPGAAGGFGLPGENAHAPNEWMALENFDRGMRAMARLYELYGTGTAGR